MLEDVDRIHEAGQYLLRLVNMILDLAKLEAGRMQFDVKAQPTRELVEGALAAKQRIMALNGNKVVLDLDPALAEIQVDRVRFAQLLEAIIENAAQHTEQGTLTITMREQAVGDDMAFSISVSDTGAGIDPAVLPTLFETFTASRDAATGRYGGTGLNLTVTHHLCKAMGGTIDVESTLGEGSCFTIVLPRHPPTAAAAEALALSPLAHQAA
jgi:signal transduction histidine kinase